VNNICSGLPSAKIDDAWSVEGLSKLRDTVASHGISLDMVPLPMSSSEISRAELPAIYLDKSPERDRAIDDICQLIRNCAKAGIMQVKYNFTLIGIPRSGTAKGRGPSRYSEFVFERAKQDPPLTIAGKVDADTYWERITYFLERVVPVAEEYKVKMGCHPQDPGVPKGTGWRGVDAVLGSPDGLEEVRVDQGEPVPRAEFLPGHRSPSSSRNRASRSSTSSATSARARRSSACTSATSKAGSSISAKPSSTTAASTC
jgi:mannonate dehydratase